MKKIKFFIYSIITYLSTKLDKYDNKLSYILISIVALVIVSFGIHFFIELTESLQTDFLKNFDESVSSFITSFRNPKLTSFLTFITDVGDKWGYLAVFTLASILFYYFFKNWMFVFKLLFVLVIALSSNLLLKQLINRQRPTVEHLVSVQTLSYPSGHAMTAMAFYGFLIYLVLTLRLRKSLKYTLVLLFSFLILTIGISRIYLGVHYPSDIIGGFIAGFIWVIFCILILNLLKIFRNHSRIVKFMR